MGFYTPTTRESGSGNFIKEGEDLFLASRFLDGMVALIVLWYIKTRCVDERLAHMKQEKERCDYLLSLSLPGPIVSKLREVGTKNFDLIAERIPQASVMFADMKNFKDVAKQLGSHQEAVSLMNGIFQQMDDMVEAAVDLVKIKPSSDGGLNASKDHLREMVATALNLRDVFYAHQYQGVRLDIAFGVAVGPLVAGIVGRKKFCYEIYGDVVNTASRMCSLAHGNDICVTEQVQKICSPCDTMSARRFSLASVASASSSINVGPRINAQLLGTQFTGDLIGELKGGVGSRLSAHRTNLLSVPGMVNAGFDLRVGGIGSDGADGATVIRLARTSVSRLPLVELSPGLTVPDGRTGDIARPPVEFSSIAVPYRMPPDESEASQKAWTGQAPSHALRLPSIAIGSNIADSATITIYPDPSPEPPSPSHSFLGMRNSSSAFRPAHTLDPSPIASIASASRAAPVAISTPHDPFAPIYPTSSPTTARAESSPRIVATKQHALPSPSNETRSYLVDVVLRMCAKVDGRGRSSKASAERYMRVVQSEVHPFSLNFREKVLENRFRSDFCTRTWGAFLGGATRAFIFESILLFMAVYNAHVVGQDVLHILPTFYWVLAWSVLGLGVQTLMIGVSSLSPASGGGGFRTRVALYIATMACAATLAATVSQSWSGLAAYPFLTGFVVPQTVAVLGMRMEGMVFAYKAACSVPITLALAVVQLAMGYALWQETATAFLTCFIWLGMFQITERSARIEYLMDLILETQAELVRDETIRSANVLLSILPRSVILKLLADPTATVYEEFKIITILQLDIAGFTSMSSTLEPLSIVTMLNTLFTYFDFLTEDFGIEKITTIGDAYVACSAIPPPTDSKIGALSMQSYVKHTLNMSDMMVNLIRKPLRIRIGIHTGPACGTIMGGPRNFRYDLIGDSGDYEG
ncbi:nucleotide cyclase [Blyttiomyces helicus]|uniref:Nucleotide cyclase n=1 Tax=Blyttiomyces helicus TaxID=388810 RepID=A0A4P9WQ30_9FUNG|nr:nucleotide cyclase [Blyttiomyces helicus]|eukprot:RKO94475.1 nucleotide cyclase [Blyttiomyces helicus]